MKTIFVLASLLSLAPILCAQVREEMAPPAPAGVPDTEYCPPDTSNGIDNFDPEWSNGYSVEINAPSADSGVGTQGLEVVEGTNDGPYVPSTFMSYQDALAEGVEELSEMGSVVKAEPAQAREVPSEPESSKPSEIASKPPVPDAKSSSEKLPPIVVPQPTVAEAARENREKQAEGEKAKVVVSQDSSGRMVLTERPAGPQDSDSAPQNSQ
jgi:hypothetical protein